MSASLPLERVGQLHPEDPSAPARTLFLRRGMPLSYLRVEDRAGGPPQRSLARALIEARAMSLGRRMPVLLLRGDAAKLCVGVLWPAAISSVFPALEIDDPTRDVVACFLTRQQVLALQRSPLQAQDPPGPLPIRGSETTLLKCVDPAGVSPTGDPFAQQYWSGVCRTNGPRMDRDDAGERVLIWPNKQRTAADRGEFVACMPPELRHSLGSPRFVLVENAADPGKFASALVREDDGLTDAAADNPVVSSGDVEFPVALDRGLRQALGINGGEAANLYPWPSPNLARRLHALGFTGRSVFAHPSGPLNADLEKPVCRLSADAMTAIGARDGDRVVIEALVRSRDTGLFARRTISKRVLTIDPEEAARRASWSSFDADEGFVDCAGFHGTFPPFPSIYIDFFDLQQLFTRTDLVCPVVQVRTRLSTRFADDLGEFAWIGVIGLVAVLAQAADLSLGILIVLAITIVLGLILLRVRRSLR